MVARGSGCDHVLFLSQAKATQASLQCETEGLSPATLIPQIVYLEKQQLKWYYKNRSVLTIYVPGITSPMEQIYASGLQNNVTGRNMIGTWRVGGEMNA